MAGIGTFFLTGKWPEEPEDINDFVDLWSIKTPLKNRKGEPLVISTLMFTKDYMGLVLRPAVRAVWSSPGKSVLQRATGALGDVTEYATKRVGHMRSSFSSVVQDLLRIKDGKVVLDYFDNNVYYPHDPIQTKFLKLMTHWAGTVMPISVTKGVQSRDQVDWGEEGSLMSYAAPVLVSVLGAQIGKTQRDRQLSGLLRTVWDYGTESKELERNLLLTTTPLSNIDKFNEMIRGAQEDLKQIKPGPDRKEILDKMESMILYPREMQAEKLYQVASNPKSTRKEVQEAFKFVEHLGKNSSKYRVSNFKQMDALLLAYTKTPPLGKKGNKRGNRYTYATYQKHSELLRRRYEDYIR